MANTRDKSKKNLYCGDKQADALSEFTISRKNFVSAHRTAHEAYNMFVQMAQIEGASLLPSHCDDERLYAHQLAIANENMQVFKNICLESISKANLLYKQAEQHAYDYIKIKSEITDAHVCQTPLKKRKRSHTEPY